MFFKFNILYFFILTEKISKKVIPLPPANYKTIESNENYNQNEKKTEESSQKERSNFLT